MENATARLWQMILYDYGNSVIRGVDMAEYINRDLHELHGGLVSCCVVDGA